MALAGLVVARLPAQDVGGAARRDLVVATTTSVRDAGLLDFLVPAFERLLAQAGSLEAFYARVKELAASERSIRDPLLAQRP